MGQGKKTAFIISTIWLYLTLTIEQYQASGLSAMAWCRDNQVNYQVFLYWRKKINHSESNQDKLVPSSAQFVEVLEISKHSTGIEIECQGATLRLSKDFDSTTFQRCIQLLRGF
jgi:hypothetical protein